MRGLNRAYLIGHIGHDPETRATATGTSVVKVSLATNYAKKVGNEYVEQVDWHRLTLFSKEADFVGRYAHKGDVLAVECTLKPNKWTDKQNVVHYTVELIVDRVLWLHGNRRGVVERPAESGTGVERIPMPPELQEVEPEQLF